MNELRCKRLIELAIRRFALDLSQFTVLTEAASAYYSLTPLIAALAGSRNVLALTRDSRYGSAAEISSATNQLAQRFDVSNRVEVLMNRNDPRISEADIITNLGFVRPLNVQMLQRLKPTAVIPLMWETWEFRPEDLDLSECRRLGISVLGTNEHHKDLRIFEYIGRVALKLLFESGIEVFRSNVVVLGAGEFAAEVLAAVEAAGGVPAAIQPVEFRDNSPQIAETLRQADALVVVEHHDRSLLIGESGQMNPETLARLNPALTVVHICGGVDDQALRELEVHCWPERFAPAGYMSVATDYVGPRALIDLHTAGLKVGEKLARYRKQNLSGIAAEYAVLADTDLAQGFAGYHEVRGAQG